MKEVARQPELFANLGAILNLPDAAKLQLAQSTKGMLPRLEWITKDSSAAEILDILAQHNPALRQQYGTLTKGELYTAVEALRVFARHADALTATARFRQTLSRELLTALHSTDGTHVKAALEEVAERLGFLTAKERGMFITRLSEVTALTPEKRKNFIERAKLVRPSLSSLDNRSSVDELTTALAGGDAEVKGSLKNADREELLNLMRLMELVSNHTEVFENDAGVATVSGGVKSLGSLFDE